MIAKVEVAVWFLVLSMMPMVIVVTRAWQARRPRQEIAVEALRVSGFPVVCSGILLPPGNTANAVLTAGGLLLVISIVLDVREWRRQGSGAPPNVS